MKRMQCKFVPQMQINEHYTLYILQLHIASGCSECCIGYGVSDCQDWYDIGHTSSGVYHVTPLGTRFGYDVYCDMETDGGGWLVKFGLNLILLVKNVRDQIFQNAILGLSIINQVLIYMVVWEHSMAINLILCIISLSTVFLKGKHQKFEFVISKNRICDIKKSKRFFYIKKSIF